MTDTHAPHHPRAAEVRPNASQRRSDIDLKSLQDGSSSTVPDMSTGGSTRRRRGETQEIIERHLRKVGRARLGELIEVVRLEATAGNEVPESSVRSHLNANTPGLYVRVERGLYELDRSARA